MVAFEPLVVESIGGWKLEGKKLLRREWRWRVSWRKKNY
jgi:hypothetical protein